MGQELFLKSEKDYSSSRNPDFPRFFPDFASCEPYFSAPIETRFTARHWLKITSYSRNKSSDWLVDMAY